MRICGDNSGEIQLVAVNFRLYELHELKRITRRDFTTERRGNSGDVWRGKVHTEGAKGIAEEAKKRRPETGLSLKLVISPF